MPHFALRYAAFHNKSRFLQAKPSFIYQAYTAHSMCTSCHTSFLQSCPHMQKHFPFELIMCSSGLFLTALCNSMSFVGVLIINLLDFLCSGSFEQSYLQRRPYSRAFSMFFFLCIKPEKHEFRFNLSAVLLFSAPKKSLAL